MIIWLLAVVLVGLSALLGYAQGAIRAASSIVGLILASFLAVPLMPILRPIVGIFPIQNPFVVQLLSPVAAFFVILVAVKIAGQTLHAKVEYKFKYKKESRFPHWERLNSRVGLCIGVLGGAIYFFVVSTLIYMGGYLTYQLASGDKDPIGLRTLNNARIGLTDTHFDRVVAAHDPAPNQYYEAADVVGLVYHNTILENRIRRYPPFLTLAERPEFQELGNDVQFQNLIQSSTTVGDILRYPKVKAMIQNVALTEDLKRLVAPNLKDLREFLETGKSATFGSQPLLGRWVINPEASFQEMRRARPDLNSFGVANMRKQAMASLPGMVFIAAPDGNRAFLKIEADPSLPDRQLGTFASGTWNHQDDSWQVSLVVSAKTENSKIVFVSDNRIKFSKDGKMLVFDRDI